MQCCSKLACSVCRRHSGQLDNSIPASLALGCGLFHQLVLKERLAYFGSTAFPKKQGPRPQNSDMNRYLFCHWSLLYNDHKALSMSCSHLHASQACYLRYETNEIRNEECNN